MPLKSKIVVCPYCDTEMRVPIDKESVKCKKCKKGFLPKKRHIDHPKHFHHHPFTSPHF